MKEGGRIENLAKSVALSAALASLIAAGCFFGSDSGPSRGFIDVEFVRFPSPLAPYGLADSIEVAFLVGTSGCWYLDEITLTVRNDTIRVIGTTKSDAEPDDSCPAIVVYGERRLALPPLEPGTYLFRSCMLEDTLVVAEDAGPAAYRITLKGSPWNVEGGCTRVYAGPFQIGLSNVPEQIPGGTIRVWADQIDEDPCGRGADYDYFASVRRVAEYSP